MDKLSVRRDRAPTRPLDYLDRVSHLARRALVPTSRLVVRVVQDPTGRVALSVARVLRENGFTAPRVKVLSRATLLRAELPAFGLAAI